MAQTPSRFLEDLPKSFWWSFAFLFLAVLAFHGKTIPFSNEFVYLLRLEPNFLPYDWTFSKPANEHWLFNFLFSLPPRVLSLETAGWLGRIAVWSLCLAALIKLGAYWRISLLSITASIFLWLALTQSVVGEEWIFGGFEAKTVAYVCLLFALIAFSEQKIFLPAALLGLSFSFHPAVGFWAIPAIALALVFEKVSISELIKIAVISGIFSLPGVLAIFAEQSGASVNSFDDWRFIVTIRAPANLDPFQFSKSGIVLLYAMLVFNFFALKACKFFALRFLLKFQIALGVFFLLGVALRWFEFYPLLRLMPMRLFPVFTLLFFIFTAFYIVPKLASTKNKIFVSLFVVIVLVSLNPLSKGLDQIRETKQMWTRKPDDLQKSFKWISENTPADALVIAPPHRRDVWYFSRRANVVSFTYPTYDRLSEWRERLVALTGNLQISSGATAHDEIEAAFNALDSAQIDKIKRAFNAGYLVSRAVYSYPILFETETYKVYQLP